MSIADVILMATQGQPPSMANMPKDWHPDPIGPLGKVQAMISDCLPGTKWFQRTTTGLCIGECFAFEFNIRENEPVTSIQVSVRRGRKECKSNPVDVLLQICQHYGWYAVNCSSGEWVHHE